MNIRRIEIEMDRRRYTVDLESGRVYRRLLHPQPGESGLREIPIDGATARDARRLARLAA